MNRPKRMTVTTLSSAAIALAATLAAAPDAMAARPNFRMPFSCGYTAVAATFAGHNPQYAIDWQKAGITGDAVRASAAGTVAVSKDLGNTSYGRYLIVKHSGGWSTLYAHLQGRKVQVGDKVKQGQLIGWAGSSGGVSGPHLHWEQRLHGAAKPAKITGRAVHYYGKTTWTSNNAC